MIVNTAGIVRPGTVRRRVDPPVAAMVAPLVGKPVARVLEGGEVWTRSSL